MPLISVIIPSFNSALTIAETLKSVLNQSFFDFEVLIMDGGSSDDTITIAKSLQDKRVQIFSEHDEGVYDAMNKGIDRARGEWIYFLGTDDTLSDEFVFEKVSKELCSKANNFVYGNVYFLKQKRIYKGEFNRLRLLKESNICHQAIFYRKSLFERLGKYNLEFKIWADLDFNIRCFSFPEIKPKFINLIIANYNDYSGLSAQSVVDKRFSQYLNRKAFNDSIEYKLGHAILLPFRLLKRLFFSKRI